jgi:hypothetical protein
MNVKKSAHGLVDRKKSKDKYDELLKTWGSKEEAKKRHNKWVAEQIKMNAAAARRRKDSGYLTKPSKIKSDKPKPKPEPDKPPAENDMYDYFMHKAKVARTAGQEKRAKYYEGKAKQYKDKK